MTSGQLLLEGVELMLLGMGFVFTFLVLLIGAIRLMSQLIERFAPAAPQPVAAPRVAQPSPAVVEQPDAELLAAIQAAIHLHRARRG
ncbi:OadG family transporter subunit [Pseudomonas stutzeri]|nr:OadG family transporter subunit [Stutzerimonas stutzeri]